MAELPDVSGGETIASGFTNDVKNRSVMRYSNAAARDASISVPISGNVAWLDDINALTIYSGAIWIEQLDEFGGTISGPISATSVSVPAGGSAAVLAASGAITGASLDVTGNVDAVALTATGYSSVGGQFEIGSAVESRLIMELGNGSHKWRFIVEVGGLFKLQSSPLPGDAWSTIETWNPV